ncbi:MAG: hypothetical protein RBR07_04785 [Arcobacteraceae bacterium]|nr:hypothetical protein [Arcobacteraceae bacterium]
MFSSKKQVKELYRCYLVGFFSDIDKGKITFISVLNTLDIFLSISKDFEFIKMTDDEKMILVLDIFNDLKIDFNLYMSNLAIDKS